MLQYIDRETKEKKVEKVYGGGFIRFLYGKGRLFRPLFTSFSLFSRLYGWFQKQSFSKGKVLRFIAKYGVDASEFESEVFSSFNDFFIRKLKPEVRPIAKTDGVMPADARYLFFPNISKSDAFYVKGQKLNLAQLLRSAELASEYENGTVVFARLCPVDYHRFHFPCDCVPGEAKLVNGPLLSVNPIALAKNIAILSQNKRMITPLATDAFGEVMMIEVGATNVGSIVQTYTPGVKVAKGDEKGFFEFGGSSLILLFKEGAIDLATDLQTPDGTELYCKMGQELGASLQIL